jgi:hypothetical protein
MVLKKILVETPPHPNLGAKNYFDLTTYLYLFIHNYLCILGKSTTPHPSFPPNLFFLCKYRRKGGTEAF